MTKDRVGGDGKIKELDARDHEVIFVDHNETIEDSEDSDRKEDQDTERNRQKPGRDKENRMRNSSDNESSSESESTLTKKSRHSDVRKEVKIDGRSKKEKSGKKDHASKLESHRRRGRSKNRRLRDSSQSSSSSWSNEKGSPATLTSEPNKKYKSKIEETANFKGWQSKTKRDIKSRSSNRNYQEKHSNTRHSPGNSSSSEYVEEASRDENMHKSISLKDKQELLKGHQKVSKSEKIEFSKSAFMRIDLEKSRKRRDSADSGSSDCEIASKEQELNSKFEKTFDMPEGIVEREEHKRSDCSKRSPKSQSSPEVHSMPNTIEPEFMDNPITPVKSDVDIPVENKLEIHTKPDREKDIKSKRNRDSSSSSCSPRVLMKGVSRSRINANVKKLAKSLSKDRSSLSKRRSNDADAKLKNTHKSREFQNRRKIKKRDSSNSSSSSSSSSRSGSDSSSSSSDSSSSSNSSKSSKTSLSGGHSSSSSSSTSSSSAKRFKYSTKSRERVRNRSRSPLARRRKSKSPHSNKLHVGRLSRNINKDHLYEIFGLYGTLKKIDLPLDRMHGHVSRGFAYVEYETVEEADRALAHMNGGILDGQKITIAPILNYKSRKIPLRRSPVRRPFMPWRLTPPFRNRAGRDRRRPIRAPFRRRSPRRRSRSRSRSISPRRRRTHRVSNGSR